MLKSIRSILSSITIPYAKVTNLPQDYSDSSGTKITFRLIGDNEIELCFDFKECSFNKEKAFIFARDETYRIAYNITLEYKLYTDCLPCYDTNWDNLASSERSAVISGREEIPLPAQINLKSENFKKYESALEFFNRALEYTFKQGKDKEAAFLIYLSFEALQVALYSKKNVKKLITTLIKEGRFNKKRLNLFKKSIGYYYRHYNNSHQGPILTIRECVDIHKKILDFFIK